MGRYCESNLKLCVKAIEAGGSCSQGQKCQAYLTCYNETCTKYGQLKVGEKVANGGSADNCVTRYMDPDTNLCEHGPVLASPEILLQDNFMCSYSYKRSLATRWPICGYSSAGNLICPELSGGLEKYWEILLAYMEKKPECHVSHKFAVCGKGTETVGCSSYEEVSRAFYQADPAVYSTLKDFPECLKNSIFQKYWSPRCGINSSAGRMMPAAISVLAMILIVAAI